MRNTQVFSLYCSVDINEKKLVKSKNIFFKCWGLKNTFTVWLSEPEPTQKFGSEAPA